PGSLRLALHCTVACRRGHGPPPYSFGSRVTTLSLVGAVTASRPTASIRVSLYCRFAGAVTAHALQLRFARHYTVACRRGHGPPPYSFGSRVTILSLAGAVTASRPTASACQSLGWRVLYGLHGLQFFDMVTR
ncbi:MAG: hypothetical protein PHO37_15365, partial [Kiritimatiellae bacterium]|nr:hypothetical protein [Kiritimatiellia bacterium]